MDSIYVGADTAAAFHFVRFHITPKAPTPVAASPAIDPWMIVVAVVLVVAVTFLLRRNVRNTNVYEGDPID